MTKQSHFFMFDDHSRSQSRQLHMTPTKETILILDKENHNRWILKVVLENEKYVVIAVDTMKRALENFSEFEVSGFITNYRVDQFCTLDVVRELKKKFPEAYVMMFSDEEIREKEYEEIMKAGVDDYFRKPFSMQKVLLHLKKGLKQRDITLQKSRLEEELSCIKTGRNILETFSKT